jgi:hypothetical protein
MRYQRFSFVRNAVCHERVAYSATLSGEMCALRQSYGGGDSFGGGSRIGKVTVQFDSAVVFRDRQVLATPGGVHDRHDSHARRVGARPCDAMPVL